MPKTTTLSKGDEWFYAPLKVASEKFNRKYGADHEKQCLWQVVTKDRVIEQWRVMIPSKEEQDKWDTIEVMVVCRNLGHMATMLMYEMKFVASN